MTARLFRKAADQGYEEAQIQLGIYFAYGVGAPRDLIAAVHWLRRADKQNHKHARELLPMMEVHLCCLHCGGAAPVGGPQLLVCLCHSAAYCDKDCKTELWKLHKRTCRRLITANIEAAQQAGRPSAAPEMAPCTGNTSRNKQETPKFLAIPYAGRFG